MSELISRKSVLDKIEKTLLIDDLTVGEKAVLSDVATMISLEPTVSTRTPMANIVEKLEELPYGRSYHDYAEKGIVHKYLERNDVLDIVKQEINNGLE